RSRPSRTTRNWPPEGAPRVSGRLFVFGTVAGRWLWELVVDDERDHHVHLILGDRALTHVHLLLLHPGGLDVAQRLVRPGEPLLERILEARARGRADLGNLGYRHLHPLGPCSLRVQPSTPKPGPAVSRCFFPAASR